MFAYIQTLLLQLFQAGAYADQPKSLIRRIRTTNAFALILGLQTVPYTLIFFLMDLGAANLTFLVFGAAYFLVFYLNHRRLYYQARIYLLTVVNIGLLFYSLMFGIESGVYLSFLPTSTLSLMIFEEKDRALGAFFFILSLSLFFASQSLERIRWMGAPWLPLHDAQLPFIVSIFLIAAFLAYFWQKSNDKSDHDLLTAMENLQQETTRFHRVLDSITDMIVLSDKKSKVLWVNKAFRDFARNDHPSMPPSGSSDVEVLAFPFQHTDYDRQVVQTGESCWIEAEALLRPDGSERWFNTAKFPIIDPDGSVHMIVSVCRDITRQREIENLLALQQKKMIASAKLSALGEMAAGIAHEINNPLAIIAGCSLTLRRLVETQPDNGTKIQVFAQEIENTTHRIVKIIRGLQSFSRSGDNDPFTQAPLQGILDDTLNFCAVRFANSSIELRLPAPQNLILECRPVQIAQVLLNIMNNAFDSVRDHTEKWVELGVSRTPTFVEISVTDSGPGIPIAIRERIFEPFFTSKPIGEGTGLGLSIARGLVESHGGTISLDETCQNTCIRLRLPILHSS